MTQYLVTQAIMVREWVSRVSDREEGQDMIEYALLAALISIVAIIIILAVGPYLDNLFQDIVNSLGKT